MRPRSRPSRPLESSLPALLLEVRDLRCERDDRVLFEGLDCSLAAGRALQLRGENGAGKTTLLRVLSGLHPDWEGSVLAPAEASHALLCLGHRAGISGALTPTENLRWYGALGVRAADTGRIHDALARVGLAGYEDVPCQQLSAGQQRRVALARLALDDGAASLWLLDEPFTALDTAGITLVVDLMQAQLDRGGAVIFATHQDAPGLDPLDDLVLGAAAKVAR